MVKVASYFGNVNNDLPSIAFYIHVTKIALALWLAERHECTRVCKHSCDLKIPCCEGRVYLIYPFPWLLRLEKYRQTCWINFFSASWHSKRVKSIWFEIVFQQKQTWLRCITLSNFSCALANHANTCQFQNIRFSIAENSTSLRYFPIPHLTSLHNCLEFSQGPLVFTSGYAITENVYRVLSF